MFIVVEGGEFTGKTTLIENIKKHFSNAIYTRGLGGSDTAKIIRELLMRKDLNISKSTKTDLIMNSLITTDQSIVKPNNPSNLIICDRWIPSFYAYQHVYAGKPKLRRQFEQYFDYQSKDSRDVDTYRVTVPDYTIYLVADKYTILSRLKYRKDLDNLDEYYLKNIDRIKEEYTRFQETYEDSSKYIVFDTSFIDEITLTNNINIILNNLLNNTPLS